MEQWKHNREITRFQINGKHFTVSSGETPNSKPTSVLVDFIRKEACLPGTKYMCREGGCGCCVVSVRDRNRTFSVNSCLIPVLRCHGWKIKTIEALGNSVTGYNEIQKRLVDANGTQCGWCTPGFVMNMYSLLKEAPATMREIEGSVDGNICRCTGFRPILDAFKTFASDATPKSAAQGDKPACPLQDTCTDACSDEDCSEDMEDLFLVKATVTSLPQWTRPRNLNQALNILRQCVLQRIKYRVVAGNTSTGVYKHDGPYQLYIDISHLRELKTYNIGQGAVFIGAGISLKIAIDLLKEMGQLDGYEYGNKLAKHWKRIANTPVRNMATLGGNLMMKHEHKEFASDPFITLEGIGAEVTIATWKGTFRLVSVADFLNLDMNGNLILSVHFPLLPKSSGYFFRSYKITRRYENSHAYVNGSFLFNIHGGRISETPRICFGGINNTFVHASATEDFLTGKPLIDESTLQQALKILEDEVNPSNNPVDGTQIYRKSLARNLLYKTILGIAGSKASPQYISGGMNLERKLTSGKQTYDTNPEEYPSTEPVTKLEAAIQASGEAEYINDIYSQCGELFGAFLLTKVGNADLQNIDAAEALKHPGVVKFISAKDIPGRNHFGFPFKMNEEIFVSSKVVAAGQALGLLLAHSRDAAFEGIKKIKVTYANVKRPVLEIQRETGNEVYPAKSISEVPAPNSPSKHNIKGHFRFGPEYHFQMETQTTLCVPKEGGFDIFSSTQWMDAVQVNVAEMLGVSTSTINVQVRRLGGSFGAKQTRPGLLACAGTLGAHITNKPVRVVMDLETNMEAIGKRPPYLFEYEVGFDDSGKIDRLTSFHVADSGLSSNDNFYYETLIAFQNIYKCSGWQVFARDVNTNTPTNTFFRNPGRLPSFAAIESIIQHVAFTLGKDPIEIQMANMLQTGDELLGYSAPLITAPNRTYDEKNLIPGMIEKLKQSGNYDARRQGVVKFNADNRWRKRGLTMTLMRHTYFYISNVTPCFVGICHEDGSVVFSHGAIEMGQGVNTKVAQVIAATLGIPLNQVNTKPSNNLVSLNAIVTAGDTTSLIALAAFKACNTLLERMAPVKAKLGNVAWKELVAACHNDQLDLRATNQVTVEDVGKSPGPLFDLYAVSLIEVELDMLTGESKTIRADIIQDAGKSQNPLVDIGQVEGAYVMGLGLWTLEKLVYDKVTGKLLTNNTWEYKVPMTRDIPEDFRVHLVDTVSHPLVALGAKGISEAPMCLSIGVVHAMREAITSARKNAGVTSYFRMDTPVTAESVLRLSRTSIDQLRLSKS